MGCWQFKKSKVFERIFVIINLIGIFTDRVGGTCEGGDSTNASRKGWFSGTQRGQRKSLAAINPNFQKRTWFENWKKGIPHYMKCSFTKSSAVLRKVVTVIYKVSGRSLIKVADAISVVLCWVSQALRPTICAIWNKGWVIRTPQNLRKGRST